MPPPSSQTVPRPGPSDAPLPATPGRFLWSSLRQGFLGRTVLLNLTAAGGIALMGLQPAALRALVDGLADVRARPGGYGALVGEQGLLLSGGERQRIAIARAFLKDAPILVLDEATSSLVSETARQIQDALWQLFEGRTVIAIVHRLSTIADMDRILVLENGRIVEEGRHADLLARNGSYAQLWACQAGGFLPESMLFNASRYPLYAMEWASLAHEPFQ